MEMNDSRKDRKQTNHNREKDLCPFGSFVAEILLLIVGAELMVGEWLVVGG
jgi:hypothetical protein